MSTSSCQLPTAASSCQFPLPGSTGSTTCSSIVLSPIPLPIIRIRSLFQFQVNHWTNRCVRRRFLIFRFIHRRSLFPYLAYVGHFRSELKFIWILYSLAYWKSLKCLLFNYLLIMKYNYEINR